MKKKISISILLAALLAIISVTALAAGGIRLFAMSGRSNPVVPLESAEELVVTDLGRAENESVVLTVEEAVYDGQGVMALVRLTPQDPRHFAMYNPYLQDAPDEVYNKARVNQRVGLGDEGMEGDDGAAIDIVNRRDYQEMLVDGTAAMIPADIESARRLHSPVYMDGDVMRMTDSMAMEVTGRKDGRELIDYDIHLILKDGTGDADFDGMLAEYLFWPECAEGQPDGSALVWFNGYAETPMTDHLQMAVSGETLISGQSTPLESPGFTLSPVEHTGSYHLIPETHDIDDVARIKSATINLSRVRGYFTIEYEIPDESLSDTVDFRVLTEDGKPLTIGMGWAGSGGSECAEQYEFQAMADLPDRLILEALDQSGNSLVQCSCRVEAAK